MKVHSYPSRLHLTVFFSRKPPAVAVQTWLPRPPTFGLSHLGLSEISRRLAYQCLQLQCIVNCLWGNETEQKNAHQNVSFPSNALLRVAVLGIFLPSFLNNF